MSLAEKPCWVAFAQSRRIAVGDPQTVVSIVKKYIELHGLDTLHLFDARSSEHIEMDWRGTLEAVLKRVGTSFPARPSLSASAEEAASVQRMPGRPRLGVTGREVTLLPRHWAWLASQPGGASVALRKLVEHAMRENQLGDRIRLMRESVYRFMTVMAGDLAGYEEATRALFASDMDALKKKMAAWPSDIQEHILNLTAEISTTAEDVKRQQGG